MKYSDYKELMKPNIVLYMNAIDLNKNIERLMNKDKDFKNNNYDKVLNYALKKQMDKEKKNR